ncbi:MAG: type II restriction endonuclease [Bacteroidales bacterium]|nr:type II restriction endonuclease [Bacteroidales bacterium]
MLRGRDIKRYGYDWAGLWLINTHNGVKGKYPRIDINDYPAIKAHLDSFGAKVSNRADQGDTPYNLRNCAYLDDFNKPKIVYPNMTKYMPFVYDEKQFVTNQKCFIITGRFTAFLTAFFNSSLFKYCFRDSFPELQGGTRELSKIFFDKISVIKVDKETDSKFKALVDEIQREYTREKAINIDNIIFDMYGLNEEEKRTIGFVEIR